MKESPKRRAIRVERLKALLERLLQGFRGTTAEMRAALTSDEWARFKQDSSDYVLPKLKGRDAIEFASYKKALRRGDAVYTRALKLREVGFQALKRGILMREADHEYGHAMEILEQLFLEKPHLTILLDRPFDLNVSDDPEGMPRPLGSSSPYCEDDGSEVARRLAALKLSAVRSSLRDLEDDEEDLPGDWKFDPDT